MVCTVDLGAPFDISALEASFTYQDAWIFMPRAVTWSVSMDGQRFVDLPAQAPREMPDGRTANRRASGWRNSESSTLRAHPWPMRGMSCLARAATEPSWLFVDEWWWRPPLIPRAA